MKILILALALAASACSSAHHLTECRGSYTPANPGKWQPTPEDLHK